MFVQFDQLVSFFNFLVVVNFLRSSGPDHVIRPQLTVHACLPYHLDLPKKQFVLTRHPSWSCCSSSLLIYSYTLLCYLPPILQSFLTFNGPNISGTDSSEPTPDSPTHPFLRSVLSVRPPPPSAHLLYMYVTVSQATTWFHSSASLTGLMSWLMSTTVTMTGRLGPQHRCVERPVAGVWWVASLLLLTTALSITSPLRRIYKQWGSDSCFANKTSCIKLSNSLL